jgi:hypothetical protein
MASWQGTTSECYLRQAHYNKWHFSNSGMTAHSIASTHPDSLPGMRQAIHTLLAAAVIFVLFCMYL